jgi:hypothetical protein
MIEFAMAAYLGSRPLVVAAVGTNIFGDKAPQKQQPPFITYETNGGTKYYHSRGACDLQNVAIPITCKATTYLKAHQLYEILRNELDGFKGIWDGIEIQSAFLSAPINASTPASTLGSDAGHEAVRGVLAVHYKQSIPTLGG